MKRRRANRPIHRASRVLTLLAILAGVLVLPAQAAMAAGTTYYVNCSAASNGNGTQASPWNSVTSVNNTSFGAGDSILFAAGTTCTGQLTPHGSGTSGSPVTMGAYGTGAKPVINANGATGPVIHLLNQQYWEIGGLELTNPAASPDYRSGVLAENSSGGILHHIRVHDMYIHNISGWSAGWYSTNAGVGVQTDHTTPVSTFDDVVVENNTFDHVDRIAVAVTPDGNGQGTGLTTRTVIRGNTMTYDGGDDVLVVKGSGALIENNKAGHGGLKSTCPPSGQVCNRASAGIWVAGSQDSVIQGNEVYCQANFQDGQAYDVDWGNHNTTIQYNYSHQNLGGFLLVMPASSSSPSEPTATVPSDGTVVRYNVSENDGSNSGCPESGTSNHADSIIDMPGNIPNKSGSSGMAPLFYNNTFYVRDGLGTQITGGRGRTSVSGAWSFENNAVFNYGSGGYLATGAGSVYSNNLFYGRHPSSEPADAAKVVTDPEFRNPGNANTNSSYAGMDAYQVHPSSPVVRAGAVISNNGGQDAFGNPVSATAAPNIGAYNGTGGNLVANAGFETGSLSPWTLGGSGSSVVTSNAHTGTHSLQTGASGNGANQNLTGLTPNTTYLLTGWAKVANAGETLAIGVKNYGGTETFTNVATTSYSEAAVLFTTGSTNTTATLYCWKNSGGTAAGNCDDIAVERVSTPANLLTNAGFESGSLSPWTLGGSGSSVVTSNARTGTHSLQTGASGSGVEQATGGLSSSATYLLTGWAKAAGGSEQVALGVKNFGGTESFSKATGTAYAQQPIFLTTGSGNTSATVYCYKNSGTSAGYCDDYTLIKIS
ncbi:carbohydrate binding domain-containing protein [Streptomyces sp. NBC_00078]|uniref:carbohydrate binding domain-containing protein n=1 Tax=unclassified Streptomyces TaxID=2593676 RepID=UPI002251B9C1|nr:carbohydrate binding domain-containing protein [Streptomyces sp. NBC_00078]MCX5422618.1 carbohydrate binding domain-containing protein [Streptomyces sp. NBC_00078]